MTSNTTKTQAATDGGTAAKDSEPQHGLAVLRRLEAQGLARVINDAVYETQLVTSEITKSLSPSLGEPILYAHIQQRLLEALTCLETADHYLRMLDGVIDPGEPLPEEPIPFR